MTGWAQADAERQEEEAEHRRAAIRDPHNAAYHEARAENNRLKAALEPFAALLDPDEDWGAITIVDIGVRIEDVRRARDLLVAQAQQKAPPGGGAGG